jgi:hypothetical protein
VFRIFLPETVDTTKRERQPATVPPVELSAEKTA